MVAQIVKSKSGQGAFDLLDVCPTILIGANLSWVLISPAGGAGNQTRQVPPSRPPARLWQRRVEMSRLARREYIVVGLNVS